MADRKHQPEQATNSTPTRRTSPALKNTSTRYNLMHQIGRLIVSGEFPAGSRLPDEATMLSRFSVSRTTLRETYSKLTAKGMLYARPKVGTFVTSSDEWNMLDADVLVWQMQTRPVEELAHELYALRRLVEPGAAALSAEFRSSAQLAEIERAFRDMQANKLERGPLVEADLRFHVSILKATGNHFIGSFSSLIHAAMMTTFEITWRGAEAAVITDARIEQHREVLVAIKEGDPEQARTNMEQLLDASIGDILE